MCSKSYNNIDSYAYLIHHVAGAKMIIDIYLAAFNNLIIIKDVLRVVGIIPKPNQIDVQPN